MDSNSINNLQREKEIEAEIKDLSERKYSLDLKLIELHREFYKKWIENCEDTKKMSPINKEEQRKISREYDNISTEIAECKIEMIRLERKLVLLKSKIKKKC